MDIMTIGLGMIIIPVVVLVFVAVGMLFHLMSEATIEAYRCRNVINFLAMLFVWSFAIGIALILIGDVLILVGSV